MNVFPLLAGLTASGVAASVWLVLVGLRRRQDDPFRTRLTKVRRAGARAAARRRVVQLSAAGVVGVVVWALTGWPVAGFLVAGAVVGLPYFFGAGKIAERRIERLEALEEWVRRLADSMSTGSATVPTIVRSAEHAPAPIRLELQQLASRLDTPRYDRKAALRAFANELDDPLADTVVLALELAVSASGTHRVTDVLRALAPMVADEVRARREVETERAAPRSEARLIVIVQVLFVVGITALTDYTKVYGTFAGQVVLAGFGLLAVGALWFMRRLSLGDRIPRILTEDVA